MSGRSEQDTTWRHATAAPAPAPFPASPRPRMFSLSGALHHGYGLRMTASTSISTNQSGTAFHVTVADGRDLLVKVYRQNVDLVTQTHRVTTMGYAIEHGVPGPTVLPDIAGEPIHNGYDRPLMVRSWIDADPPGRPMDAGQARSAGAVLAQLHHTLARMPPHSQTAAATAHNDCDNPASAISSLPARPMTPIHGAFTSSHLLFKNGQVTGVIGYQPVVADPALELGRAAFDVRTVDQSGGWLSAAAALIYSYLNAGGPVTGEHLAACGRLALGHALSAAKTGGGLHALAGPDPAASEYERAARALQDRRAEVDKLLRQADRQ